MVTLFVIFFSLHSIALCNHIPLYNKIPLSLNAMGPEALAFASSGGRLYTGVEDGRILEYRGPRTGFTDFSFTSPNRSRSLCDGNKNQSLGPVCGRPLGLGYFRTGDLYIADAYHGLLVAGRKGTIANQLAISAEGVAFRFANGLDVDQRTGIVYFTDASSVYTWSTVNEAKARGDATGRLLKYDPKTAKITVLMRGLQLPSGNAVSRDGSFVLVTELTPRTVQKYWLKGPKANTAEILVTLPGSPGNIKSTPSGAFWVAVNLDTVPNKPTKPVGVKMDGFGKILKTLPLDALYKNRTISEVQEFKGGLYIGSQKETFVGVVEKSQKQKKCIE